MFRSQQISKPFIFCVLLTASQYYVGLSDRDLDCQGKHTNQSVMNFALQQAMEPLGGGEQRFGGSVTLPSAQEGGGWSTRRPGRRLPPRSGKRPGYHYARGSVWPWVRKISPSSGFDPQTVQP